jgi:predicted enzyme related to lactoylglutathione lyase
MIARRSVGAVSVRVDVNIDCTDVDAQARFWAAALGYERFGAAGPYRSLVPPAGTTGPKLVLQAVPEARPPHKNRLHLDVVVGDSFREEAERLEGLGARALGPVVEEHGTAWIVMADPEGNEFCVCRA